MAFAMRHSPPPPVAKRALDPHPPPTQSACVIEVTPAGIV
jgi:hypothetical protein